MHFMTTNKVQKILSVSSDFHSSQLVTGFQKKGPGIGHEWFKKYREVVQKNHMKNCFLFCTFFKSDVRHENI